MSDQNHMDQKDSVTLQARDTGRTPCGHRNRADACPVPDGKHEFGEGNAFNADGHARCECCGLAVCDEPMYGDRNKAYEEDGQCVPCLMATEKLSIEDVAAIEQRGS